MPKLVHIAPLEAKMTGSFGFGAETSEVITRVAGAAEILFGVLLIVFYRSVLLMSLNIAALMSLLFFVAISTPELLMEAFNPVTTNIPLIALSVIIIASPHGLSSTSGVSGQC